MSLSPANATTAVWDCESSNSFRSLPQVHAAASHPPRNAVTDRTGQGRESYRRKSSASGRSIGKESSIGPLRRPLATPIRRAHHLLTYYLFDFRVIDARPSSPTVSQPSGLLADTNTPSWGSSTGDRPVADAGFDPLDPEWGLPSSPALAQGPRENLRLSRLS
ncbi:hypothetical protein CCMA1212_004909 [Trichoderma ghanense]|uniref:Uncharacterized protein n=1 Tax=Trichoderma ghanense TaxID=65468 RepID=A0ABY2H4F5_9HYPO